MSKVKNTTPAPATPKTAKAKKLKPISDYLDQLVEEGNEDGEEMGKIECILKLYIKGYSRKEIISAGFNKTTVYRQTNELRKLQKAPALNYYGYDLYEARIQKVMQAKKLTREDAVSRITEMDINSAI